MLGSLGLHAAVSVKDTAASVGLFVACGCHGCICGLLWPSALPLWQGRGVGGSWVLVSRQGTNLGGVVYSVVAGLELLSIVLG